jgi:DNA-binding beta-propeller fold protein YncE
MTAAQAQVALTVAALISIGATGLTLGQRNISPQNDAPNPYTTVEDWATLPSGREWGSTGGVDMDRDGAHIWVAERCGGNSCAGEELDPILKFDSTGRLVASFGAGLFIQPHGLHVDQAGHIWVTDAAGPNGQDPQRDGKGHVVMQFSRDGELLMTLGTPGIGAASRTTLDQPCDVIVAGDGTIYVADGHGGQLPGAGPHTTARIVKFAPDGTYLMEWGSHGTGPGQFRTPHAIALDSQGRVVVADRGNDRLQVFDPDGQFIEEFYQYSRPSGLHIADDDTAYVADSASSRNGQHPGWEYGIRIGNLRDGSLTAFIDGSNPEGVAVAADGTVYGAVVAFGGALLKYSRPEQP